MCKNILLYVIFTSLALPGVFMAQSLALAQAPAKASYTRGWQASIISVPENFRIVASLPPAELASFVASKSAYTLNEYMSIAKGSPPVDFPLWKGEGFLNAEEAGFYVFSILRGSENVGNNRNTNCSRDDRRSIGVAVYVDGNVVTSSSQVRNYLMGALMLEPGLHKVEFRIAGSSSSNVGWNDNCLNSFNMLIKGPSDNRGLPISEVLLRPVDETK